jgi:hypothetical protein
LKDIMAKRDSELLEELKRTVEWHGKFTEAWKKGDKEAMLDLGNDICLAHFDLIGDSIKDPDMKAQIALELVRTKLLAEGVREKNIS